MGRIRIVAGRYRGRQIQVLDRPALRPTSDRAREGLFNVLGPQIEGIGVCDLFAGSGALGFEALSRGAERVTFVESDRPTARALRANAELLGCEDQVEILTQSVDTLLSRSSGLKFDLILADPPYLDASEQILPRDRRLAALMAGGESRLVVESESCRPIPDEGENGSFSHIRRLKYGRAAFDLYVPTSLS